MNLSRRRSKTAKLSGDHITISNHKYQDELCEPDEGRNQQCNHFIQILRDPAKPISRGFISVFVEGKEVALI